MHDNPQPVSGSNFALPDHRVLELSGRDAAVFAQAQFMNEVAALPDGAWQWNGWLTPKGRLIALFALIRLDAQRLWLLLPDADPTELAMALRRFVFRSKLEISPRPDLFVSGSFRVPPTGASRARWAGNADTGIELDLGADDDARNLQITPNAVFDDNECIARWKAFDLEHGLPRLPSTQVEQWTPQQMSLDRLNAYSVRKGCYPGQEIVARTHFLGQAKRGLVLFDADAAVTVGSEVRVVDAAWGSVVSTASTGDGHCALAVGTLDHIPAEAVCNGVAMQSRPLLDGLAR